MTQTSLQSIQGDCDEYDVAQGLGLRCLTLRFNMEDKSMSIIGPRKVLEMARDAYESYLRQYHVMCSGRLAALEEGQIHLLTFLKFPASYMNEKGEMVCGAKV